MKASLSFIYFDFGRTQDGSPSHFEISLSEEIWQKVASFMDVRDWAKISGLCKKTWQLDLPSIMITQSSSMCVPGEH